MKFTKDSISSDEFSSILAESDFVFEKNPHIGICVSGGPDSLALLMLMKDWVKKKKGKISLMHFNHNLRKESTKEAEFVKEIAKRYGINFKILKWDGNKPSSSLMSIAREQRYRQIISHCKNKNIISLMTAHHLDDLLETYLMRKKRKYSTLGLNSIPKRNTQNDLQILRPLLEVRKERLIQTCIDNDIQWLVDPTNEDEKFERTRTRKFLNNLTKKNFCKLYQDFKILKNRNLKIEDKITNFFTENIIFSKFGLFQIRRDIFLAESSNLQIEIIKKILVTCSGKLYPPRTKSIKYLLKKIINYPNFKYSLHSCIILIKNNEIGFYKEYQLIKNSIQDGILIKRMSNFYWDNRFNIKTYENDILCHKMSEKIWLKIKGKYELAKQKNKINFDVLKTLPVLKICNELIIPFLLEEKELKKNAVSVIFQPKIPLTKKNF